MDATKLTAISRARLGFCVTITGSRFIATLLFMQILGILRMYDYYYLVSSYFTRAEVKPLHRAGVADAAADMLTPGKISHWQELPL